MNLNIKMSGNQLPFPNWKVNRTSSSTVECQLPEILIVTTYPPRECGIANYSQDLINALNSTFVDSFRISICSIGTMHNRYSPPPDVKYLLNADDPLSYTNLTLATNSNKDISLIIIQHEFGIFANQTEVFEQFVMSTNKPVILTFHTVLPQPADSLKRHVLELAGAVKGILVLTDASKQILMSDYGIPESKITVIPHGTHLVTYEDRTLLKQKYNLSNKLVLSTFGLLSSGKSIETTLDALPDIVLNNSNVLFLIIGKTHPGVLKQEQEQYRHMLEKKVETLGLNNHVQFINQFVALPVLLDYLQLTDIYLFTSKNPQQAVSGTFSYALNCGCTVVTTPIAHALDAIKKQAAVSIGFGNSGQLAQTVNRLLKDKKLRDQISNNAQHYMASTAWQNSAIAHANLFRKLSKTIADLHYRIPAFNLTHIKNLTKEYGIVQFSKLNHPDIDSGYTLDDNARALIAMCQHYALTGEKSDINYINTYLDFIIYCQDQHGRFKNYVNQQRCFTSQNEMVNLADSGGRAIWALGYLLSLNKLLPEILSEKAEKILEASLNNLPQIHSTRSMAFIIKGLYFANTVKRSDRLSLLIRLYSNRLVEMYKHESSLNWQWFECYLTYGNSVLPEALLYAWLDSGVKLYKETAIITFNFLLSRTYRNDMLKLIPNKSWLHKGEENNKVVKGGEQPIDVAYTIIALETFYMALGNEEYIKKLNIAFEWFLGRNHLKRIMYNQSTGGCYDGLEDDYINLNQGSESAVSYLMARISIEKQKMRLKHQDMEWQINQL